MHLINDLLVDVLGFYNTLSATNTSASPGDSVQVQLELVNRYSGDIKLTDFKIEGASSNFTLNTALKENEKSENKFSIKINTLHNYSTPYWLEKVGSTGMYRVDEQHLIGQAENEAAISASFKLDVNGEQIVISSPLIFRQNDRIKGEVVEPFYITPPASIEFENSVVIFTEPEQTKRISVAIKALRQGVSGQLEIALPDGWSMTTTEQLTFDDLGQNEVKNFPVAITSGGNFGTFNLSARATLKSSEAIEVTVTEIVYEHIPNQVIIGKAKANLVLADVQITGEQIGYIPGAGDLIPEALEAMGFQVNMIDMAVVDVNDLLKYRTIVAGIRAYNTNADLQNNYNKLFDYMNAGGKYIVQYNTTYSLPEKEFFPYQLSLSRDRITDETATLSFINPQNELLNRPNKITSADFQGWVQERGLYFPASWGSEFQPLLKGNDAGEAIKEGSLLVAKYGKGQFIYTGLSFFRELPAGVPGAYRLFANLVSY